VAVFLSEHITFDDVVEIGADINLKEDEEVIVR